MPENRTSQHQTSAQWWQIPNILAVDAPAIAVLWMAMVGRAYSVKQLPAWDYAALFAATWLIYLVDRLLDNRQPEPTARHSFASRHRWLLIVLTIGCAAFLAFIAYFKVPRGLVSLSAHLLPGIAGYFGLVILRHQASAHSWRLHAVAAGAVLAALLLVFPADNFPALLCKCWFMMCAGSALWQSVDLTTRERSGESLDLTKQISCGALFAAGVALSSHFAVLEPDRAILAPLMVLFALNCIGIGIWEQAPQAQTHALTKTHRSLFCLGLFTGLVHCGFILAQASAMPYRFAYGISLTAGFLALALLHVLRPRLSGAALRVLADVALLAPLAFVFLKAKH